MTKPWHLKFGLLALILPLFFFMLLQLVKFAPRGYPVLGADFISRFEDRLTPIKQMLRGEEVVGYLGDHADPSDAEKQRNFQITQYVLAPVMVTDKRPAKFFVAVRPLDEQALASIEKNGLVLLRDFDDEVRIYERRQP